MSAARAIPAGNLPAEEVRAYAAWPPAAAVRGGVWLGIAAITMLFLAFTSAYIVRHGLEPDWQSVRMPRLVPVNTLFLLVSSICLEAARRGGGSTRWVLAALAAGILFLLGQFAAWTQLAQAGLHFASSAHASFFYTMTVAHAAHLAGGLLALGWTAAVPTSRERWLDPTAIYWHFMGALWAYLVIVLFWVR